MIEEPPLPSLPLRLRRRFHNPPPPPSSSAPTSDIWSASVNAMDENAWQAAKNEEGSVEDWEGVRKLIFFRGLLPSLRPEVNWKELER